MAAVDVDRDSDIFRSVADLVNVFWWNQLSRISNIPEGLLLRIQVKQITSVRNTVKGTDLHSPFINALHAPHVVVVVDRSLLARRPRHADDPKPAELIRVQGSSSIASLRASSKLKEQRRGRGERGKEFLLEIISFSENEGERERERASSSSSSSSSYLLWEDSAVDDPLTQDLANQVSNGLLFVLIRQRHGVLDLPDQFPRRLERVQPLFHP